MPSSMSSYFRVLWTCLLLLVGAVTAGAAPPAPPKASAKAQLAAALAAFTPSFGQYVFDGEAFPDLEVVKIGKSEGVLPPTDIKVNARFYDRTFHPAPRATVAGPYGAVVELTTDGHTFCRFISLYRTAAKVDGKQRLDTTVTGDLADALGIKPAILKQQEKLLHETLGRRTFAEWSRDPKAARLLAGLSLATGDSSEPIHKYDDAFAVDRQWWVGLKRKLYGWDKAYPQPFVGPRPKAGIRLPWSMRAWRKRPV